MQTASSKVRADVRRLGYVAHYIRGRFMAKLRRLPDWTARVIIRNRKGILMVLNSQGEWEIPGGRRNPEDKDPISTAKRELLEETRLPSDGAQFHLRFVRSSRQGKKNKYDVHYYECVLPAGTIEEHLQAYGLEGEKTCIYPYKRLCKSTDVRAAHLSMLRRLKCLRPPPIKRAE